MRRFYRWLEARVFQYASRILVTTPGTATYYQQRYGETLGSKLRIVPNGFDPETFPRDFAGEPLTAPKQATGL